MRLYQSFLESFKDKFYYGWTSFVRELPHILLKDKNLIALFSKYPFFKEKQEEITIELIDDIYDELEYWTFYLDIDENTEMSFYDLIYNTSSQIFKELISKYVPSNIQSFESSNRPIILTVDDIKNYENEFDEDLIEDELELDIKNAEVDFSNFLFDRKTLINKFRRWDYQDKIQTAKPIIQSIPLIKKIDYFDPAIYEVIKKEPSLLKTMDWRLFEEMLADILRRFKYSVELTKATKDGGIDIIAIKKDENFGMHKYLLQAKRYTDAVQVSPVRELLFLHDEYKATKSCLATTARFTSGAWNLAENHKWKMELKDQQGILEWIDKVTSINT